MKIRNLLPSLLVLLFTAGITADTAKNLTAKEGYIDVPGGKVWYRIVGSGKKTPLLLLHGGPGVPSYYLKPLAALGDERPVIFYDQLGCGHSDHPDDTTLWTTERFVKELARVREVLGLKEVYILGQSWGTMLATEYLLTKPSGVKAVIMASPSLSLPRWLHDADSLLATLPDSIQQVVHKNETAGTTDSPEYQSAVMVFYHKYVARKEPWSADIDSSFMQLGVSEYLYMCGPSEFAPTGTLRTYDRTDRLHEITIPTLFTAGEYDEATPSTVRYYQSLVPNSKTAIVPNAAHLTMQDDSAAYIHIVRDFLHEIEKK